MARFLAGERRGAQVEAGLVRIGLHAPLQELHGLIGLALPAQLQSEALVGGHEPGFQLNGRAVMVDRLGDVPPRPQRLGELEMREHQMWFPRQCRGLRAS